MWISHVQCKGVLLGPVLACQENVFPESRVCCARREGVHRLVRVLDWAVALFCANWLPKPTDHGQYGCTFCSGMSVDHSVVPFTRSEERSQPVFLSVKAGMTVICGDSNSDDWWMADVIHVDGGARDPKVQTLFQVADVDAGLVRWVCADLVTHIVTRC